MYVLKISSDFETPITAYIKLRKDFISSFLLESAEYGTNVGRYSFLGFGKRGEFILTSEEKLIIDGEEIKDTNSSPLSLIEKWIEKHHLELTGELPPFRGGAVGFVSYSYIKYIEEKVLNKIKAREFPYLYFIIPEHILAFDHLKSQIIIISEKPEYILKKLKEHIEEEPLKDILTTEPISNFSREEFIEAVLKAKEYIKEGDIFQVVLSHKYSFKTHLDKFFIYRALRMINPSPYMFYIEFKPYTIFGSSPEMLIKSDGERAILKPIAGTRKRGKTLDEDLKLEKELLNDEKEKAEHIMLVDLGRNDLGKVSRSGSVDVTSLMVVERYSHVLHLVSQVEGILEKDRTPIDALISSFPAGTVTGAPKIRAMEIIEELEKSEREAYGGAVCYISYKDHNERYKMDSGILIRSFFFKEENGFIQAGAGIVYDSIPENEYKETINKLNALIEAINLAKQLSKGIV